MSNDIINCLILFNQQSKNLKKFSLLWWKQRKVENPVFQNIWETETQDFWLFGFINYGGPKQSGILTFYFLCFLKSLELIISLSQDNKGPFSQDNVIIF